MIDMARILGYMTYTSTEELYQYRDQIILIVAGFINVTRFLDYLLSH